MVGDDEDYQASGNPVIRNLSYMNTVEMSSVALALLPSPACAAILSSISVLVESWREVHLHLMTDSDRTPIQTAAVPRACHAQLTSTLNRWQGCHAKYFPNLELDFGFGVVDVLRQIHPTMGISDEALLSFEDCNHQLLHRVDNPMPTARFISILMGLFGNGCFAFRFLFDDVLRLLPRT